jgi:hypothetical protein
MKRQTGPRRARLTGRAAQFVHLLQDFGHLDEEGASRLMVALADGGRGNREEMFDLHDVRRLAAAMLFGQEGENQAILEEDWPLLFY